MKEIRLTQEKVAIVDDDDYERVNKILWNFHSHGYAVHSLHNDQGLLYMHRFILGCKTKDQCDHINRNKLDNRKSNLRQCTRSQNQINRGKSKNNSSGYKGVSFHKTKKLWYYQVEKDGVRHYLGCYRDPVDAAMAYDEAVTRLYGEDYYFLNFPEAKCV